ncbi:MAG: cation transporter [Spirochaetales bacterium]|nr:cation transporter [Spirochaetales bacterium]
MKQKFKKLAYIEGWISIVANILLFSLKYWTGITTRSVAIVADAWHTLSDSITSIVVLIGARASSKPPDKEHPFGHERAELIASIIISVLLGVVGFNFLVESIKKLIDKGSATFGLFAIIVTLLSVVIKEGMAIFAFWAAKKTNSGSLKADGWHHQSDAITSGIILVGIFLGNYFWWIDSILGMIIALFILYAALTILREGASPLIGEKCPENLIKSVQTIAAEINSEIIQIHHVHIHKYGSHTELSFHIRMRGDIQLSAAHELASELENTIKERLNIDATIHMEPIHPEDA